MTRLLALALAPMWCLTVAAWAAHIAAHAAYDLLTGRTR